MYKLLIVLLLFSQTVQSQESKDWGAFMKVINAKTYAGKKFRIDNAWDQAAPVGKEVI